MNTMMMQSHEFLFRDLGLQLKTLVVASATVIAMSGCAEHGLSNTEEKALIGVAGGAVLGQAIGGNTKSTVAGVALGGVAGALYGSQQDKQRKYYKDQYGHTYYLDSQGRVHYVD